MYATVEDMTAAFGERECRALSGRGGAQDTDVAVITTALEQASAEIDGYLLARYPVPFADHARVLRGRCCDIARYQLCGAGTRMTEAVRFRYEDAIRFLERVADGRVGLGRTGDGEVVKSSPGARFVYGGRTFRRGPDGRGGF